MGITKESFHGSDLEVISKRYRIEQNTILPYASNVNPLGISPMARQALIDNIDAIRSYPDREYLALKSSLSSYCNIDSKYLILGNGASDLIRLTLEMVSPAKTLIVGPTYSEYARSAKIAGSKVETYMLSEKEDFQLDIPRFSKKLNESIDLLILCNPNNPTGQAIPKEDIERIVKHCLSLGIFVMIDETYVEFVEEINHISSVSLTKKYDNLVVLRGISKFFAAPGLRLGYAITSNEDFLSAASNSNIPWNINSLASVAGVMFNDEHYITLTRNLIKTERNLITAALSSRKSIKVFTPSANFVLIKLLKEGQTASEVFQHCIQKGFMIRDCSDYEGLGDKYIRFCFLKPEQNDDVVNTILEIV